MKTTGFFGAQAPKDVQFWSLLTYRALVVALLSTTSFFSFKVYQTVSLKGAPPDQISIKLKGISANIGELIEGVEKLDSDIEDQKILADQATDSASQAADSANEAAEACGDLRFR